MSNGPPGCRCPFAGADGGVPHRRTASGALTASGGGCDGIDCWPEQSRARAYLPLREPAVGRSRVGDLHPDGVLYLAILTWSAVWRNRVRNDAASARLSVGCFGSERRDFDGRTAASWTTFHRTAVALDQCRAVHLKVPVAARRVFLDNSACFELFTEALVIG